MLLSTFAFSLMQLCVKFLNHLPTAELVFFRSIISLVLSLVYLMKIKVNPLGNNRKYLIMRGVFGLTALFMFFHTLQHIPLASAVTLQYLSPIFTAIFAIFILKEKVMARQWLYFLLAFVGVVIMKGFDERVDLFYFGMGLSSAFFAGLAYNCIRKLRHTDHPLVVVLYFPLIATPIMGTLSYLNWVSPQGWDWMLIGLLGIFTQIGQIFMTKALHAEEANKVASLKYLGTVYAFLYGYLFFDESFHWASIAGMSLVLIGVVLNIRYKTIHSEV